MHESGRASHLLALVGTLRLHTWCRSVASAAGSPSGAPKLMNCVFRSAVAVLLCLSGTAFAQEESTAAGKTSDDSQISAGERLFALQVQSLLISKCFACHGHEPDAIEGELDLTSRAGMIAGGSSGEVILHPGNAAASALYAVLSDDHESLAAMPPKENDRLSEPQAWAIRDWINAGAPWPDEARIAELRVLLAAELGGGVEMSTSEGLSQQWDQRRYKDEEVWAYRPLRRDVPPRPAASVVDAFIDQQLAERDLQPAEPADRRTLARRVSLDLTGLPPDAGDLERLLEDPRPDELAIARYADRLLASPHYGEQWGRHWLDVVRYADSSGFANDYQRPNAWRYRDYVIRAMNEDKPYDVFIRQQVAGDEINPEDPENLIAVGFLRMGPWEQTGMSVEKVTRQQFLDDVTDAVGQVFLAHPLQCARCHDHKFDPVPTRDYYRIQACFATTQFATRDAPFLPAESTAGFEQIRFLQQRIDRYERIKQRIDAKRVAEEKRWYAQRGLEYGKRQQKEKDGVPREEIAPKNVGLTPADLGIERIARKYLTRHRWEEDRYEPLAYSVYSGPSRRMRSVDGPLQVPKNIPESGQIEASAILSGGDPFSPSEPVSPGVLSAVAYAAGMADPAEPTTISDAVDRRRTELAQWLSDPTNPLPPRVMVNRLWQGHFGRGIAGNPNNFGTTGAQPTHRELLDWLAADFVAGQWSIKRMHRRLMNTDAYRRSARHPEPSEVEQKDPLGTTYARFAARRLAAEELRDAMLIASGSLNRQFGGIPVRPDLNPDVAFQPRQIMGTYAPSYQPNPRAADRNRRTIYALRLRGLRDPTLETFNQPSFDSSCERRETSTVAPQALTLWNGPQAYDRALAMAASLLSSEGADAEDQRIVRAAFRRALNRSAEAAELQACVEHLQEMTRRQQKLVFEPAETNREVVREAVDEITGETFSYRELLEQYAEYESELKPWQADPRTRAVADLCLVLLNSNEFLYVE